MHPARRLATLLGPIALAAAWSATPMSAVHADMIDVVCVGGSHTVKWDPPLTFEEQTDTEFESNGGYGGEFTGTCDSSDPTIGAMTFHLAGVADASCTSGSGAGNLMISWDNGNTSFIHPLTVSFAPNPNGTGLTIDATGPVHHGQFQGQEMHASFTQAADPTLCATTGVAEASGPCPHLTIGDAAETAAARRNDS